MADVEMRLEGFDELRARLRELSEKDSNRILNNALRAGAEVFQTEEAQRAPERPDLPSSTALPPGALRQDVTVKKLPGKLPVWIIGPGKYTSRAAHLVEFGHRLVRGGKNRLRKFGNTDLQVGPGTVVGFVPAHPYVRPAFEAGQQLALDAIAESMQADISRLDHKRGMKAGR